MIKWITSKMKRGSQGVQLTIIGEFVTLISISSLPRMYVAKYLNPFTVPNESISFRKVCSLTRYFEVSSSAESGPGDEQLCSASYIIHNSRYTAAGAYLGIPTTLHVGC